MAKTYVDKQFADTHDMNNPAYQDFVVGSPDYSRVNSSLLAVQPKLDVKQPEITYPTAPNPLDITQPKQEQPTATPDTTPQLGKTAQSYQDIMNEVMGLNTQVANKDVKQQEAEAKSLELQQAQQRLQDYQNQFNMAQTEYNNIPNLMQEQAGLRRTTAGMLGARETSALRQAAINMNILNSNISREQGNLATAQSHIDKAINLEFAPLEAKQAALIKNLNMIKDSPAYTEEERQRAADRAIVEEKRTADIALAKKNKEDIYGLSVKAQEAGATPLVVSQIQKATSPEEALQIYSQSGVQYLAERKEMLMAGYTLLKPSQLQGLTEAQITRMPNGDIYKKPVEQATFTTKNVQVGTGKNAKEMMITYDQYGREVKREILSAGGGDNNDVRNNKAPIMVLEKPELSPNAQAVIENPKLFKSLTATEKNKIVTEIQNAGYDTTGLTDVGISDTAKTQITQTQKALNDLRDLRVIMENNKDYIGPITGLQKFNPWSKAKQIQADINRVKQTVGKALEGGVLRKEDEEKYKEILATMLDTPETALYKIDQILVSLQRDLDNYQAEQELSGKSLNPGQPLVKKNTQTNNQEKPPLNSFEK